MSGLTQDKAARALADIFHPAWSPQHDMQLLTLKGQGVHFDRIAMAMMRNVNAVQQRWHRLRKVPNIERLLRAYGLTTENYPAGGVR